MSDVRIAVKGIGGRMGQRIAALIEETPGVCVGAGIERVGSTMIGHDVAVFSGGARGVLVTDSVEKALASSDVLIDFTVVDSTLADLENYRKAGKAVVIGTTGFKNDETARIRDMLKPIPYVLSPNMSIGVNVLFNLVRQAALALGDDYDVEITEAHHRFKKDSPSGTAVKLAEVAADALGRKYPDDAAFRQRGMIGERTQREIGMQVIRAGDIVGDHTVYFGGLGERLELTHRAHTRDTFARGAIRAALWIHGKAAAGYDMQDVLGLRGS